MINLMTNKMKSWKEEKNLSHVAASKLSMNYCSKRQIEMIKISKSNVKLKTGFC
jgi:hypothetical protein